MAIKEAADILAGLGDLTTINFYVDSQAALCSVQTDFLKSKTAYYTISALNCVEHQMMVFVWTKAHIGTVGNEEADALAKEGSTSLYQLAPSNRLSRRVNRPSGKENRAHAQRLDNPNFTTQRSAEKPQTLSYNGTNYNLADTFVLSLATITCSTTCTTWTITSPPSVATAWKIGKNFVTSLHPAPHYGGNVTKPTHMIPNIQSRGMDTKTNT